MESIVSRTLSVHQEHELLSRLEAAGLTAQDAQQVIGSKDNALAKRILALLRDFFRETGELTIDIPALSRPSLKKLHAKFSWIKAIERDTSPTEAVTLRLGTVLRPIEGSISGFEYWHRLAPKQDLCLGYQQAVWLVENQSAFPALMAQLGKIHVDFPGLVVERENGNRHFPCLRGDGERWSLDWFPVQFDFIRSGRIASRGK